MKKSLVVLFVFGIFFVMLSLNFGSAVTNVSACGTLNTANGVYTLNQSISGTGTCITIGADNVTLDCQGFNVTYSTGGAASTYGIYVSSRDNFTILNCIVLDGNLSSTVSSRYGIFLTLVSITPNYFVIHNNSVITNNSNAIRLSNIARGGNVTSNNFSSYSASGLDSFRMNNSIISLNRIFGASSYSAFFSASVNNSFLYNFVNGSVQGVGLSASQNNLLIGNEVLASTRGIHLLNSNENNLTSNVANSTSNRAIYFDSSNNSYLYSSRGYAVTEGGIVFLNSKNNSLVDNIGVSNSSYGISVEYSSNFSLINNSGTSNSSRGIRFYFSDNNYVEGNNGTSLEGGPAAAFLFWSSSNNTLIRNIGNASREVGLELKNYSNFNLLVNNFGYGTGLNSMGIMVWESLNNTLINNTGTSDIGYGIAVIVDSNFTILTNNTAITGTGRAFNLGGHNNQINSLYATGLLESSSGIYISSGRDNVFRDCRNISGVPNDLYIHTSASGSATMINCSYNLSKEKIDSADGEIIRKWYFDANVSTSNTAISSANLTIYNSTGNVYSELTNSNGNIIRQELIEYINTGGTRSYFSNYSVNVTKNGYYMSSTTYNLTISNNILAVVLLSLIPQTSPTTNNGLSSFSGTFKPTENSLMNGWNVNIGKNQKVEIPVGDSGEKKTIFVESVSEEKVVVSVGEKNYEIINGEIIKIDTNGDGYYDIEIINNGAVGSYANLTFTLIYEEVLAEEKEEQEEKIIEKLSKNIKEMWYIYTVLGLVVLGIVAWIILKKQNKRKRHKKHGY